MVHRELNMASRLFGVLKNRKVIALAGSITVAGGLIASASGATGAFFSDTKNGTITGTLGTVKVQTSGGSGTDGLDFAFSNLMPGVAQTANVHYKNTGVGNQDIYLVFPNATALSALNELGAFGEVHIGSNGTEIFADANLNDKPNNNTVGVPRQIRVGSNLAPGAEGDATFSFNYASKLGTGSHSSGGGVFNTYPAPDGLQTTTVPADGHGSGLPYQIVAVQVGQTP